MVRLPRAVTRVVILHKTTANDVFFPICHLLVWLGFPITNKSFNDV